MSFFDAISVAASGLTAERVRMDVTSENLANADTTNGANGQPYQEQEVQLQTVGGSNSFSNLLSGAMGSSSNSVPAGGVEVTGIVNSSTPDQEVYDPGDPSANSQGYVKMPNVSSVNEMVDMIDESRSYESDVTAMSTAKEMFEKTLDLLK